MVDNFEKDINHVIEEMMGFSLTSDKLANEIIAYIHNEIKLGNIRKRDELDYDERDLGIEIYTLDNYIHPFEVEGKPQLFGLEINLINCPSDMDSKEFHKLVHDLCEASCGMAGVDDKPAYVIQGNFVFKDWKLGNYTKNIFHHEIKHAYTHIKTIKDSDIKSYMQDKGSLTLRKLYMVANKIMSSEFIESLNPRLAEIAQSIYVSDKQELSSFTQQAYKDMESVTSFQEVDKTLRKTELYVISRFLDDLIKFMENDDNSYNEFIAFVKYEFPDDTFPTKHSYLKTLKKRCEKYKTNVGRVLVYTKDRLMEDAIKEGYSVPLIVHDTNLCELYKLGLY